MDALPGQFGSVPEVGRQKVDSTYTFSKMGTFTLRDTLPPLFDVTYLERNQYTTALLLYRSPRWGSRSDEFGQDFVIQQSSQKFHLDVQRSAAAQKAETPAEIVIENLQQYLSQLGYRKVPG